MTISYSIGKLAVTMVDPETGAPRSISNEHPSYHTVVQHIKAGGLHAALETINVSKGLAAFSQGRITIQNGSVFYDFEEVPDVVAERVLQLQADGFDVTPMVNFLTNLYDNPSRTAIHELWAWIEQAGLTITNDGHFIAWKGVTSDYRDRYSGLYDNSVGANPKKERREVDDNADKVCSYGFHVGTFVYADRFGKVDGKLMECKVNPKDVVAVASDGRTKVRVCEYLVIGEVPVESRGDSYTHVPLWDAKYLDNADDDDADEEEDYWDWDNYADPFADEEEEDEDDEESNRVYDPESIWYGFYGWLNAQQEFGFKRMHREDQYNLAAEWCDKNGVSIYRRYATVSAFLDTLIVD